MLIGPLTSLIDHSFLQLMITCKPNIVTQEGWTSQGTRWNQTLIMNDWTNWSTDKNVKHIKQLMILMILWYTMVLN